MEHLAKKKPPKQTQKKRTGERHEKQKNRRKYQRLSKVVDKKCMRYNSTRSTIFRYGAKNMPRGGKREGAGKPKGSKNGQHGGKKKLDVLLINCRNACDIRQHDPFLQFIRMAQDPETSTSDKIKINVCLTQFLQPTLRSVEHSGGPIGQPVIISLDPYTKPSMTAPRPVPKLIAGDSITVNDASELPALADDLEWERVDG